MFQRLRNSWQLVKASWRVLLADKELLIFPIISAIASFVVMLTFLVPSFLAGVFDEVSGVPVLGYVIGFLFYVAMAMVTIFFNAAIVGAATIRLQGGDPTVGDGLRIAFSHIGSILGYAVISATVGIILRALSERGGVISRIVIGLIGLAWNLATFLVVPVLVVEGLGPIEGVKRSASLLKQTWGEQIAGNLSIGLIFGVVGFVAVLLFVPLLILAVSAGSAALIVGVVVLGILTIVMLSLISTALNGIYTAAVYQFAIDGKAAGEFFDPALIQGAFKYK